MSVDKDEVNSACWLSYLTHFPVIAVPLVTLFLRSVLFLPSVQVSTLKCWYMSIFTADMCGADSTSLLRWCQGILNTGKFRGVHVTDLTCSWRSGLALCALIQSFRPEIMWALSIFFNKLYFRSVGSMHLADIFFFILLQSPWIGSSWKSSELACFGKAISSLCSALIPYLTQL